jgi:hypothetical protein
MDLNFVPCEKCQKRRKEFAKERSYLAGKKYLEKNREKERARKRAWYHKNKLKNKRS